jgi:UDP-N-acetylmuramoylalanine--D-glutamate ligase
MLEHLAITAKLDHTAGGNVGTSYARQVKEGKSCYRFLEVSSFQLDQAFSFAPHVAILTNITEDHLDRYDHDLKKYALAKMRMVQAQTSQDYFIYNADDPVTQEMISQTDIKSRLVPISLSRKLDYGTYLKDNQIITQLDNIHFTMPINELQVKGSHNAANAMAASTAAHLLRIRKETIRQSMASFSGVEHRLEPVLRIHKVQYINDSKATNVNATYYALESMERPTVWIVGGVDKGNDYSQLNSLVHEHVKAIVCLGLDNSKIIDAFSGCVEKMVETASMEDAVRVAYKLADAGDNVLLSPACASFDLFENYEDRGRKFKEAVRRL